VSGTTATELASRRKLALGAVALAVVLLAVLLLRPGGRMLAPDTENVIRSGTVGFTAAGQVIAQPFRATADDLSQVTVRVATGGLDLSGCSMEMRLLDDRGRELGRRTVRCEDVDQAELVALDVEPLPSSDDRTFVIELTGAGPGTDHLAVWTGAPDPESTGVASFEGVPLDRAVEVHSGYGDDSIAAGQLDEALSRIGAYGAFWRDPWAVVLLAGATLALLIAVVALPGRRAVALLVGLAVVKGVLWAAVVPVLQAPDEPSHVSYAMFLAEQHRLPKRGVDQFGLEHNESELMDRLEDLLNVYASPPGHRPDFSAGAPAELREELRGLSAEASGNSSAAGYGPAYYVPAAAFYALAPGSLDVRIDVMRLWSVALGALSVWLALLIGRRLFPSSPGAASALAVAVAMQPMFSQQTATVNNDALLAAAGFACLLAALDLSRVGAPPPRTLLLAGLALGVAIMTKPQGVAFAPVLGLAWLLGRWRTPPSERPSLRNAAVFTGAGFAATYGLWWVITRVAGIPPADLATFAPEEGSTSIGRYLRLLGGDELRQLRSLWVRQFWGDFGQLNVPLPGWVRATLTVATLGALLIGVAWFTAVVRDLIARRREGRRSEPEADEVVVRAGICALAVVSTLVVLHVADFIQFRRLGRLELLQGRYALMALPAILALPALWLRHLFPRIHPAATMSAIAAVSAALNVGGLALIVERSYL
jgi:hypothetical protein